VRTLSELYEVDQGFAHTEALRFNLTLPPGDFAEPEALVSLFREVEDHLLASPGVAAVGSVVGPPLGRHPASGTVEVSGRPSPGPADGTFASVHATTPGFFSALGLPILQGRSLAEEDLAGTTPVAVVSEHFVRENFPDQEALGERFQVAVATGFGKVWTIVGVVQDTRSTLTGEPESVAFVPMAQALSEASFTRQDISRALNSTTIHVRGRSPRSNLIPVVEDGLRAVNPGIMTANVETVSETIRRLAAPTRHQLQILALFAALTVVLAAVGLYGIVLYLVSRRTKEIGIRMALGAQRAEIAWMVVGQGIIPAVAGLGVGLGVSFAGSRLLVSLLYQVEPTDPVVYGSVAFLILALSTGAVLIPALQATRLDPVVSLKTE
jgi:putative ABC transport system permease protein